MPTMKLANKKSVLVLASLSAVLAAASDGAYWWQTGRFLHTTDVAYVGV
ncbi:HlyD family secretion protein, partial [Klebsiella quasipneumoniae]|nr:HlyD family secretion protein [Klebsiella quasipneumoniae]